MAWSVDRLGRSLQDLVAFLSEIHTLRIDLYLDRHHDTGRIARESMRKIASRLGVSTNTVLKVARVPFEATAAAVA